VQAYEKTGRIGRMMFLVNETTWTNQNGELIKVDRKTSIRY
jgi:hypothetical protein